MALTESTMLELGTTAPAFSLPDVVSGKIISLKDLSANPLLVLFICELVHEQEGPRLRAFPAGNCCRRLRVVVPLY